MKYRLSLSIFSIKKYRNVSIKSITSSSQYRTVLLVVWYRTGTVHYCDNTTDVRTVLVVLDLDLLHFFTYYQVHIYVDTVLNQNYGIVKIFPENTTVLIVPGTVPYWMRWLVPQWEDGTGTAPSRTKTYLQKCAIQPILTNFFQLITKTRILFSGTYSSPKYK